VQLEGDHLQELTPTTEPRQVAPRLVGVLSCLPSVGYSVHVGQLLGTNERGATMPTQDHCNPFGIERPTSTTQAIRALLGLRTLLNGALFEGEPEHNKGMDLVEWGLDALGYQEPEYAEHYEDGDDWQKDTDGNWGQAFASALGSDSAPACWKCGASERIGDYCKACLSNQ
jgi:hypothetical protein